VQIPAASELARAELLLGSEGWVGFVAEGFAPCPVQAVSQLPAILIRPLCGTAVFAALTLFRPVKKGHRRAAFSQLAALFAGSDDDIKWLGHSHLR
jgi:hypothetical protein